MKNIDDLSVEELETLVDQIEENKNKVALEFFPDKNPGFVKAIMSILKYSKARLEMLDDLSKGRNARAENHKKEMEKAYRTIPEYAQW